MSQFFFGYLAIAIISLSILVITRKNPVHCVLFMLILFFHIAGLYIFLNAEFLAVVQVIVYAGAILVLFLIAILVLNLKEEIRIEPYIGSWPVAVAAGLGVFLMVLFGMKSAKIGPSGAYTPEVIRSITHTKAMGREIFTHYLLPFEVVSLVLLVAVIGALVLAKKKLKS